MTDTTIAREEVAALRERYAMQLADLRDLTREQRREHVVLNDIEWLLFAVNSLTHALDESQSREKAALAMMEAARGVLVEHQERTEDERAAIRDGVLEGCAALLDQRADAEVGASERMAMTQAARLRFQYAATVLCAVSAHIRALKSEPSR